MSSQKQPNRKPPFAFARFEHCPNGGTKIKNCYLSNKDIQPNEISYKIRFRDYNDSKDYFISEEVAQKTPEFMTCIKMYNENMFPPELLFDTPLVAKNTSYYDYVIDKFRLQEYLKDNLWKDVIQSLKIIDKDKTVVDDINQSFVAICGFICSSLHIDLLKFWDMISPELQLTLALSDNQKFRLKAYETGLLKDFKPIYELLSKNKQSVKDMLFLANWGKGNPDSLKLLQKADDRFFIFDFSLRTPCGFHNTRYLGKGSQLLFLFTANPELCPTIRDFDPLNPQKIMEQRLAGYEPQKYYKSFQSTYFYPYLYRAKVFSKLMIGDEKGALECMEIMKKKCISYYTGNPSGYINQTEKILKDFLKIKY